MHPLIRMLHHLRTRIAPTPSLPTLPRRPGAAALARLGAVVAHIILLAPAGLGAQDEPGTILRGSIVAADARTPLPEALVELVDLDLRTRTDMRGRFALGPVPVGTHRLRVLRVGYEGVTTTVEVTPSATPPLHLEMTRSAVEMDPLQVLASRTRMVGDALAEVPLYGAAHLITSERIQAPEFVFGNIHDLLRTVPGVNLQEEDGYGLRPNIGLRGSGTERSAKITLMEDGVLIAPAPYAAPAAYYFPTAARMHAVEVRTGASQIRYGPRTTGGAINLVSTPIPDALTWSLEAAGGSEGTLRTQGRVGGAGRHVGWMVEGFRLETNGFKALESGASTGFLLQDYVAKVRVNTDRSGPVYQQLELKAGYNDELSHETYLGLTDADFQTTPLRRYAASDPDRMDADQRQVQLRHFISGRRWDVTTTAYRHDFARNWYKLQSVQGTGLSTVLADPVVHAASLAILKGATSGDNALRMRANNREYYAHGLQTTAGFRFTSRALRHNIEVGVRIHRDAEDRLQWEDGYRMASGRMERISQGAPGSQDNRVGMADAVAVFLQDEITIGRWSLTPGLRHEKVDFTQTRYAATDPERTTPTDVRENGVSAWIPGLSVAARPSEGLEIFAGLHRGFGPPGPGANVATQAELSWNYEAGARLSRPGVHAQLSAYASDYSNILGVATLANSGDGSGDTFNGGSVLVKGLEASLEVDLAAARDGNLSLPLSLSYSLTDAQFRSTFESNFDSWGKVVIGDQLPYVATSQFSASFGVANQNGRVMASVTGSSAVRTQAGQGPRDPERSVDGFVTANLSGEWRLPRFGTVFSAVQNLTDARYAVARRPAGLRPGLPRTVVLGIRIAR